MTLFHSTGLFGLGLAVMLLGVTRANMTDFCDAKTYVFYPMADQNNYELVQVSVVTRHGDRAPYTIMGGAGAGSGDETWDKCDFYDHVSTDFDSAENYQRVVIPTNLPFSKKYMWSGNCLLAQLTRKGAYQHFKLGTIMRQIFVNKLKFLPEELNRTLIYVRSTDVWRTRQSTMGHIDGLYPSRSRRSGERVEVVTYPTELETMTPNFNACPRIQKMLDAKYQTKEYQDFIEQNKEFLDRITRITEMTFWGTKYYVFSDALLPRICHNMKLPCNAAGECVTENDVQKIYADGNWENKFRYGYVDIARLMVGYFANELRDTMLYSNRMGYPRYALFSGHDDTLTPLLAGLGLSVDVWPSYASNLIFELWRARSTPSSAMKLFVRLVYNGVVQKLPGCAGTSGDANLCTWEEFSKIIDENLTIKNYEEECF